jgi:hypothetical protein
MPNGLAANGSNKMEEKRKRRSKRQLSGGEKRKEKGYWYWLNGKSWQKAGAWLCQPRWQ